MKNMRYTAVAETQPSQCTKNQHIPVLGSAQSDVTSVKNCVSFEMGEMQVLLSQLRFDYVYTYAEILEFERVADGVQGFFLVILERWISCTLYPKISKLTICHCLWYITTLNTDDIR